MMAKALIDKDGESFTGKAKTKLEAIDRKLHLTIATKGRANPPATRIAYDIVQRITKEIEAKNYSPTLVGLSVLHDHRELLDRTSGFSVNEHDVDSLYTEIIDQSNITKAELKESNRLVFAFAPYLLKVR
jgi:hypothetical protein